MIRNIHKYSVFNIKWLLYKAYGYHESTVPK